MHPVLESLRTRKSVRAYLDMPIAPAVKQQILQAAAHAPTAGNQQLYTILDITDETLKQQLAVTCDHQPFIAAAPLVLVFCADPLKWVDAYEAAGCAPRPLGPGDLLLAMQDAVIAAQNAVTAAWSLGVGSCYIGDILEQAETHRELLHLPPQVMPATMVVFGYPTPQQLARQKPERMPLSSIVQENTYRRLDADAFAGIIGARIGQTPYESWIHAFCERKYNADFAREMNRSAAVYLDSFTAISSPEKET